MQQRPIKFIQQKQVRASIIIIVGLLILVFNFQACSPGRLETSQLSSTKSEDFIDGHALLSNFSSTQSTRIAFVNSSETIWSSMNARLGIQQPSNTSLNQSFTEKSKISDTGTGDSITAPMWNAVMNISGQVCADLLTQEKAFRTKDTSGVYTGRRIFPLVDFSKGPADSLKENVLNDIIRRLSRSLLSRNETPEEMSIIKEGLAQSITPEMSPQFATETQVLFTCTVIASSLEAQLH